PVAEDPSPRGGSRREPAGQTTGGVQADATFVPRMIPIPPLTLGGGWPYSFPVSSLVSARRFLAAADLPMVAPAIVYVALFAGVGAWYPYQSVLLASRGLDFGEIG